MLDNQHINPPTIQLTKAALEQLTLIFENDFTLEGKVLRLQISGKGCDGFEYSVGFTEKREKDFLIKMDQVSPSFLVALDSFAAFYLQEATVDFFQDFENDLEGFLIHNHNQKKYSGKFWRENPELVPPTLDRTK